MSTHQAVPIDTIRSILDEANELSSRIYPIANEHIQGLLLDLCGSLASVLAFCPVVDVE